MKELLVTVLSSILIYILVGIFSYFSSKDRSLQKNVIKLNEMYLGLSIVFLAFFAGFSYFMSIVNDDFRAWIVFLVLSPLGISLAVSYFNCRIFYDENSLTYRNFWGKKTTIRYCEITEVEAGIDFLIFSGKRKIKITSDLVGRGDFFELIKPYIDAVLEEKERRKKENDQPLPAVRNFWDSVCRPGEFVFVIVLYSIGFLFCFTIFVIYASWFFFGLGILLAACAFCTYYAPKRAHSSEFWLAVAKLLVQESHLKLDKTQNTDEDQQGKNE